MSWLWGSKKEDLKKDSSEGAEAEKGGASTGGSEPSSDPSRPTPVVAAALDERVREIEEDEDDYQFITTKDEVDRLQGKIHEQGQEIQGLQTKLNLLNSRVESSDKTHRQELTFRDRQLAEKEEKISELTRKVFPLERELQSKVQLLTQQIKACEDLSEANSKVKAQLESLQTELSRAQTHLKALSTQSEAQAETHRRTLAEKVSEVSALTRRVTQLEEQVSEQRRMNQALQGSLEAAMAQQEVHKVKEGQAVTAVDMQLKAVQQQNCALQSENKQLRADLCELRQAQVAAQGAHDQKLAEVTRAKDLLSTTAQQLQSQLAQVQKDSDKAQAKSSELSKQLKDKETEVASLTTAAVKASEEAQKASESLKRRAVEVEGLQLKLSSTQQELKHTQDQLKEANRVVEEQKKTISAQALEVQRQRDRVTKMQEAVEEITAAVDTTPEEDVRQSTKLSAHYRAQVSRIMRENPDSVPVRCVRAENCTVLPLLDKKKLAVQHEMTLSRFNEHIRSKLGLSADKPLSVYVDFDGVIPDTEVLGELYAHCKNADGFLRLKYSHTTNKR